MQSDSVFADLRESSRRYCEKHAAALDWLKQVRFPCQVAWLNHGWASENPRIRDLVSQSGIRRIRRLLDSGHAGLETRGHRVMDERCAMQGAVRAVLSEYAPFPDDCPAPDLFVQYTALGQPMPGWRGTAGAWAREHSLRLRDLHISFTHDGDAVLALAAHSPGLRGVGIDVVRLDRFRTRSRDYLQRFTRHFMSDSEHTRFLAHSKTDSVEELIRRTAAHFSLMESASKALGTGLKIGGGMGKPESMSKRSLNVMFLDPVVWQVEPEAEDRIAALGAATLEGHWSADSEYLVSAAFLRD